MMNDVEAGLTNRRKPKQYYGIRNMQFGNVPFAPQSPTLVGLLLRNGRNKDWREVIMHQCYQNRVWEEVAWKKWTYTRFNITQAYAKIVAPFKFPAVFAVEPSKQNKKEHIIVSESEYHIQRQQWWRARQQRVSDLLWRPKEEDEGLVQGSGHGWNSPPSYTDLSPLDYGIWGDPLEMKACALSHSSVDALKASV